MVELVSPPSVKSAVMLVARSADDGAVFTVAFMGIK
jgi:hypothetical protein